MRKYQHISKNLIDAIRSGNYKHGEQLPSARNLAEQWNVSYMTANKVLKKIESENYIRIDRGRGCFVSWQSADSLSRVRKVNLIVPLIQHAFCDQFVSQAQEELEALNWQINVVRSENISEIIKHVQDTSSYSMLFGHHFTKYSDINAIYNVGRQRIVFVSTRYEHFNMSCSCVDTAQVIHLGMSHLQERGCRNIGLLCSNLQHGEEVICAAVWKSLRMQNSDSSSNKDWSRFLLDLKLPQYELASDLLDKYLDSLDPDILREMDGLIITDDTKAIGICNYCFDHGIKIPEDLSIVSVNNTDLARLARPQLTVIDNNLSMEISQAVEILEEKASGKDMGLYLRFCQPTLIQGKSS
jgi:DNA-binding LacI/PurR family transcriptional regulator